MWAVMGYKAVDEFALSVYRTDNGGRNHGIVQERFLYERCGDEERARQLYQLMRQEGYVAAQLLHENIGIVEQFDLVLEWAQRQAGDGAPDRELVGIVSGPLWEQRQLHRERQEKLSSQ